MILALVVAGAYAGVASAQSTPATAEPSCMQRSICLSVRMLAEYLDPRAHVPSCDAALVIHYNLKAVKC